MHIHQNAQFESGEVDVTASEEGRKGIIPTHQQYGRHEIDVFANFAIELQSKR